MALLGLMPLAIAMKCCVDTSGYLAPGDNGLIAMGFCHSSDYRCSHRRTRGKLLRPVASTSFFLRKSLIDKGRELVRHGLRKHSGRTAVDPHPSGKSVPLRRNAMSNFVPVAWEAARDPELDLVAR